MKTAKDVADSKRVLAAWGEYLKSIVRGSKTAEQPEALRLKIVAAVIEEWEAGD